MTRTFLALAAVLLAPAAALASDEAHGGGIDTRIIYAIDFLIVAVPLIWFAGRMVKKSLAEKHDQVRREIDEATQTFALAEERLKAAEGRIAGMNAEAERLVAEFAELGRNERDALAREGEVLSKKIREDAEFRVQQAIKVARAELAETLVSQAFAQVEARLGQKAGTPVGDDLVDRVVLGVKGKH
jgi:F-type H+-transporting ATPase subunit b